MQDERDTPQDEDVEEVEAHRLRNLSEEPGSEQEGDEDEVEAHRLREGHVDRPMNRPMNDPSE